MNLQLLVNFALITFSRSRDCYFNMAMGSDCAVGNIWSTNRLFSQSETELRRTQLNEVGSTETQPRYNIFCRGGKRDCCPRNTAHEFYPDGNPSIYQPRLTEFYFGEQTSTGVQVPLVLAGHGVGFGQSRSGRLITNSVCTWVSDWHIWISESPQETRFYALRIHEFKKAKWPKD